MSVTPLLHQAINFAARAHRHEMRKDGVTPFLSHPLRVAMRVGLDFGCHDPEVLAAAVLHDIIENAGIDYDDLAAPFGERVATMVAQLSNDPRLPEPALTDCFYATLEKADWPVRLIKLADTLDNYLDREGTPAAAAALHKLQLALTRCGQTDEPPIVTARTLIQRLVPDAIPSAASPW